MESETTAKFETSVLAVGPTALELVEKLSQHGYTAGVGCLSLNDTLSLLTVTPREIVIIDLPLAGGMEVQALVERIAKVSPTSSILLFKDRDLNLEHVQKLVEAASCDFIASREFEEILFSIKITTAKIRASGSSPKRISRMNFSPLVAESPSMLEIFETIQKLSPFNTTVLITGESGTGKELLARAIHQNSPRKGRPFVAVNCGAIPEHLIESELFGHKRGAFTDALRDKKGLFEEADGGTIFLDEIGELPLHLQIKLLRVLQENYIRRVGDEELLPVDVRVLAATLRNLEDDVNEGLFRDDLYYRLNVVSIPIPPLRERPEDIEPLVQYFIKKHNRKLKTAVTEVTSEALLCLKSYHWRGNVRELENCIERAIVLTENGTIDRDSLPPQIQGSAIASKHDDKRFALNDENLSIKEHTRALEIELIQRALNKTKGNRTRAAKILELSHRALLYKLKEYRIAEEG